MGCLSRSEERGCGDVLYVCGGIERGRGLWADCALADGTGRGRGIAVATDVGAIVNLVVVFVVVVVVVVDDDEVAGWGDEEEGGGERLDECG